MLFSSTPKATREELFDREEELSELEKLLNIYPIVVVTGLRRVGKSSLIRVYLNEHENYFMSIDVRKLYEMSFGNISSLHLTRLIGEELNKISKIEKLSSFLRKIRGISIHGSSVEIDAKQFELSDMFEKLEAFAAKNNKNFIVFFDEAQYLKFYGARGGEEIRMLLAYSYDNLPHVRFIFTGSEVGMLHDFLKFEDPDSPLYGRAMGFLTVKPFSFELSLEFLRKGFEELEEKIDFDLSEVVKQLDGIVGYLVLFGLKYMTMKNKDKALQEVFSTMSVLFEKELSEITKRSPRYMTVLKSIAIGINTWTGLKNVLHAKGDFVSNSRLFSVLETLQKLSLVEKFQDRYRITDQVLERILRENRV